MKILHFADLHIRLKDDNRYTTDLINTIQSIVQVVRVQKPDYVVISGDLFDTKHPTMSEFALATAFLKSLLGVSKVIIVAGNHDEPANEAAHNTLQPLANLKIPNLHIFGEPGLYKVDDVDFLALPYIYQKREECMATLKSLNDSYTGQNLFFIGHIWVTGYANKICQDTEFLIPVDYLNSLTKVKFGFLGHIHLAGMATPNMYYSGSPFRVNWGETEDIKTIYMWEDGKLMAFQMPSAPLYVFNHDAVPETVPGPALIKISAKGIALDRLPELETIKKKLESAGHTVKIDLELKGIKFDAINPTKKELGFTEFFNDYIAKQNLGADKDALYEVCLKIINEQLTKDSLPFDLFGGSK